MNASSNSLRPFIGSKDFETSRSFYKDLGFEEFVIEPKMSLFKVNDQLAFYLQDAYVKDWIENTMLFLEVNDMDEYYAQLKALQLPSKYEGVSLSEIRNEYWGRECFMHDPAGVLWHFGVFR